MVVDIKVCIEDELKGIISRMSKHQTERKRLSRTTDLYPDVRRKLDRDIKEIAVNIAYLHYLIDSNYHTSRVSGTDNILFCRFNNKKFIKFKRKIDDVIADVERKYYGDEK